MAILLALLSAAAWGIGDFAAGLGSRDLGAPRVTAATQLLGLITAGFAVLIYSGVGPRLDPLLWGALSGVASAVGTVSLYHGLAVGGMTVVATLSGVLAAVVPVIVGLALGNTLGPAPAVGILIAIPAILLVSWHRDPLAQARSRAGALYGTLAGLGFGLLFISLDQAGTHSGAWPLVSGQLVSVLVIAPFALRGIRARRRAGAARDAVLLTLLAGVLSGVANLLFLAATGHGELAIVAVLASLYPAVTVLLARVFLSEQWSRSQVLGLVAALVAVVLVSAG